MKLLSTLLQPFTDTNRKVSSGGDSYFEMDGLRGIAVIIVLLSHTASFGMYGQGSLGVLMFFFLSGFVLTLPFSQNIEKIRDRRAVTLFFINRAARIIPAYWVACLVIYSIANVEFSWVLWNASFIRGWNHLWSVASEARFYLLFPIVILLLSLVKNRLIQILILLILVYFSYEYQHLHTISMFGERQVGFYFWMFLGGVLACLIHRWDIAKKVLATPAIKVLLIGCSFFCLILVVLGSNHYMETLWRPLIPSLPKKLELNGWKMPLLWFFLFLTLFLSASIYRNSILNKLLSNWFLRHIGLLSYAIYLYHMNILITFNQKGWHTEYLFLIVFAWSYLAAIISYILIEKPALVLKKRISI